MSAIHELAVLHRGPDEALARQLTDTLRGAHGISAYCYTDNIPGIQAHPTDTRQTELLTKFRCFLFLIHSEPSATQGAWFGFEQNAIYKNVVARSVAYPREMNVLAAVAHTVRNDLANSAGRALQRSVAQLADNTILTQVVQSQNRVPFTPDSDDRWIVRLAEDIAERIDSAWRKRPRVAVAAMTHPDACQLTDSKSLADRYGTAPSLFKPSLNACALGCCWFEDGDPAPPSNDATLAELMCEWSLKAKRPLPHFIGDWLFAPTGDAHADKKRQYAATLLRRGPSDPPVRLIVDSMSLVSDDLFYAVDRAVGGPIATSTLRPDPIAILLSSQDAAEAQMATLHGRKLHGHRLSLLDLFKDHQADITIIGSALPGLRDWYYKSIRTISSLVNQESSNMPSLRGE